MALFFEDPFTGTADNDIFFGIVDGPDHTMNGNGGSDFMVGDFVSSFWGNGSHPGNNSLATARNVDSSHVWSTTAIPFINGGLTTPHTTIHYEGEAGTQEFFSVTVGAGETLTADTDFSNFDTVLTYYRADGVGGFTQINTNDDHASVDAGSELSINNGETDSFFSYTNTSGASETIIIQVREFGGDGNFEGDETGLLHLTVTGHAATGTLTEGNDTLNGGDDNDVLYGLGGNDRLTGDAGDDIIYGGSGNDVFSDYAGGGVGRDEMYGEDGSDQFNVYTGDLAVGEIYDGGAGSDAIAIIGAASGTSFDFATSTLTSIEEIAFLAGTGDVIVTGTQFASLTLIQVDAHVGEVATLTINMDTPTSLDLSAINYTSSGFNETGDMITVNGDGDNEIITGSQWVDVINGGDGDDTIASGGSSAMIGEFDTLNGGAGNDTLIHSANGSSMINGGTGDDLILMQAFFWNGNLSQNAFDGGDDIDTLDLSFYDREFTIDLSAGMWIETTFGSPVDIATLANIENVIGNQGADTIIGDDGVNDLFGGAGNDNIDGGLGDDILNGGDNNDIITGGAGADMIDGGAGTDWAYYRDAASGVSVNLQNGVGTVGDAAGDTLIGIERLQGSNFDDTLVGDDATNNTLFGRGGEDSLFGRAGNDALDGGDGADALNGGGGSDWAYYSRSSEGVTVTLAGGTGVGGEAEGDTWNSIERVLGSDFDDNITGDGKGNNLRGGDGDDTLDGGAGGDILEGGAGADMLTGGGGRDFATYARSDAAVVINLATNVNSGGEAQGDTLFGIDRIIGSDLGDNITGNDNVNDIRAGDGDDILNGGGGNDILKGGAGGDTIVGGSGNDWVYFTLSDAGVNVNLATGMGTGGYAEGDIYIGIERISASNFDDVLTGNELANIIRGRSGEDTLDGGIGDDILTGGADVDTFVFKAGDAGSDTVTDFDAGETIVLDGFGYADAAAAAGDFVQNGSRVEFTNGDVSITFLGANLAEVQAAVEIPPNAEVAPSTSKAVISEVMDAGTQDIADEAANDIGDASTLQQDLIAEFMADNSSQAPIVFTNNQGVLEIMTDDDAGYDWGGFAIL